MRMILDEDGLRCKASVPRYGAVFSDGRYTEEVGHA